jgi:hypothetical protein
MEDVKIPLEFYLSLVLVNETGVLVTEQYVKESIAKSFGKNERQCIIGSFGLGCTAFGMRLFGRWARIRCSF